MTPKLRASAIILAVSTLLVAAAGPSREAERQQLIAAEKAWGQAFVKGDVATVQGLLADDFHGIDTTGAGYDKAQMIADLKAGPAITSDRVAQAEVRFYGDTAVVQAHEFVEGPQPEAHPSQRVFSDTWVKRGGRWQIVAALDMKIGHATLPQYRGDIDTIRTLRATSNAAIAKHDIADFLPVFADDAVFTWSNGSHAVGKAQLKIFFDKDFADPGFDRYVRAPSSVSVSDRGARAIERGSWTALRSGTRYGGDYVAHWMRTAEGWRVAGELYVKLYCTGLPCTP